MIKSISHAVASAFLGLSVCAMSAFAGDVTAGMTTGSPQLKSIGPLAFGPQGVLFVGDTKSSSIVAIDTGDTNPGPADKLIKVEGLTQKVASLLGTSADQIIINDMAVNPVSRNAYLAISRGRGPDAVPVLVKVSPDGKLDVNTLESVKFARVELPAAPADVPPQGNRPSARQESITDIAYVDGSLIVAGLSNEEFASTLRAIPFPFAKVEQPTSVEIFHGAHGRFETRAPVRTFVTYSVGDKPQVLAAYTCTPLVQFALSQISSGAKVRGKTIAELGNRNRPLDMIVYQKDGKDYLLLANSSRGIMKIDTTQIASAESIESRVEDKKGVTYETIGAWTNIDQLDRLDQQYALVVRRGDGGAVNLESLPLP